MTSDLKSLKGGGQWTIPWWQVNEISKMFTSSFVATFASRSKTHLGENFFCTCVGVGVGLDVGSICIEAGNPGL